MDMQNVANLRIPDGEVRTIHDKDGRLLWGAIGHNVTYRGDTDQQTYSGKNLLPFPFQGSSNSRGITFTNNGDGSITLNGKNDGTGNSAYYLYNSGNPIPTLSTGTYYFVNPGNTSIGFVSYDGSSYKDFDNSNNYSNTFTAVPRQIYIQIRNGNTTTFNNVKVWPMLTSLPGQTEADYEPYVGGIPSPNPDYPQDVQVVTGRQTINIEPGGKNKIGFDENTMPSGTLYSNGTLTVQGSDGSIIIPCLTNPLASGTYTISMDVEAPNGIDMYFQVYDIESGTRLKAEGLSYSTSYSDKWIRTFTISQPASFIRIQVYSVSTRVPFTLSNIQIEQGSAATTYEPYQGQEYTVDLTGKNLLDLSTLVAGYVSSNGTFSTAQTQAEMRSGFIKVQPNTTYTFSIQETTDTYPAWFGVGEYTGNDTSTFVKRDVNSTTTATSITFTTSATTNYVVVSARNMANATEAQLEKGSSVTSYETPWSIELCKIGDYQDYIYKSDDGWYVHKEVGHITRAVANMEGGNYPGWYDVTEVRDTIGTGKNGALSSMTTYMSNIAGANTGFNINTNDTNARLFLPRTTWGDDHNEAYWESNYPNLTVELYYGIVIPQTDIQITNQTLIDQLETIHKWLIRYGYNHTVSGNLPMIINQATLS